MKSEMERNPEVLASTRDEAIFIPAAMCEESQGAPRNAKGNLTSLRRHEGSARSKRNSSGSLSFPPQLHASYEIVPCMLEEVVLHCSISQKSPCFPWNSKGSLICFTEKESRVPCLHTRRELTPCLKRHTRIKSHVRTGEEP